MIAHTMKICTGDAVPKQSLVLVSNFQLVFQRCSFIGFNSASSDLGPCYILIFLTISDTFKAYTGAP